MFCQPSGLIFRVTRLCPSKGRRHSRILAIFEEVNWAKEHHLESPGLRITFPGTLSKRQWPGLEDSLGKNRELRCLSRTQDTQWPQVAHFEAFNKPFPLPFPTRPFGQTPYALQGQAQIPSPPGSIPDAPRPGEGAHPAPELPLLSSARNGIGLCVPAPSLSRKAPGPLAGAVS